MAQFSSSSSKPSATPLKFLLDEINFQRTKELMRQSLREEGGFVVVAGATTFWTDLFVRHFLFETDASTQDHDDLLFFVRYRHVKGSSRINPKYETDIDVFRRDSRKLPIGDPEINWEETVYLNLVIHQFDYKLTLAICTRTSPKELQVLRRHSQKVYASPSRRKMDTKGDSEEITYPNICFMVDNFDDIFKDILVRDGEMVCVELVANDKDGTCQGVIFLGSIRYEALKKVYDARQSASLSAKAHRMSFGLLGGASHTRCEFVRMKGPAGKGHAEMAVTKPKDNSGVETPTSEPGYCITDFEAEWDDDEGDFFHFRHRRRLSDPSANLSNFNRYAFRAMVPSTETAAGKARSENEGLDTLANELYEVEAGDLRDDRPLPARFVRPEVLDNATKDRNGNQRRSLTCCNCFGQTRRASRNRPRCLSGGSQTSSQMDELSEVCGHTRSGPGDELTKRMARIEIGPPEEDSDTIPSGRKGPEMIRMRSLDGGGVARQPEESNKIEEYELADDAIDELAETPVDKPVERTHDNDDEFVKIGCADSTRGVCGVAREELPVGMEKSCFWRREKFATFPRMRKRRRLCNDRMSLKVVGRFRAVPKRKTKDGTCIYYWCDIGKAAGKELDDGAYNPIWTTRGFPQQSFHFWKENKRQSSQPMNALLTYVSLPWYSIAKDLLDKRDPPVLTF